MNAKLKRLADEITTISTQFGLANDAEENEKVMFNYMNESLIHVRRQNELKMKMAKIERAENVAWEKFHHPRYSTTSDTRSDGQGTASKDSREKHSIRSSSNTCHSTDRYATEGSTLIRIEVSIR